MFGVNSECTTSEKWSPYPDLTQERTHLWTWEKWHTHCMMHVLHNNCWNKRNMDTGRIQFSNPGSLGHCSDTGTNWQGRSHNIPGCGDFSIRRLWFQDPIMCTYTAKHTSAVKLYGSPKVSMVTHVEEEPVLLFLSCALEVSKDRSYSHCTVGSPAPPSTHSLWCSAFRGTLLCFRPGCWWKGNSSVWCHDDITMMSL